MLNPDTRQTLLEALQPPPGFHLGYAVGTTYSLLLDAALTAPASFALYSATEERDPQPLEPLELLDSIRRHADRFTIFFQAGQVAVPAKRLLFAFLEDVLVPVAAPGGGVFHPKLWVLRFDNDGSDSTFRAICASRNLTYDKSWDTLLRLDSANDQTDTPSIDPTGLAEMVRKLPGLAVGYVNPERQNHIANLADQIEKVRWAVPPGVESGRFLPIGISTHRSPPFPRSADSMAVVSPFLTPGLLGRLPVTSGRRVLISRPDQLANCAVIAKRTFDEIFTLDPNADTSDAADLDPYKRIEDDPEIPLVGLHAKLFVFDQGDDATILTGSANATDAAFHTNVEFLTELTGSRNALGVERLLAGPSPDVQTLRSFLVPYLIPHTDETEDRTVESVEPLNKLRREVARRSFEARATQDGSDDRFQLAFTSTTPMPPLLDGMVWKIWPITLTSHSGRQITSTDSIDERFVVSFDGITAFFANEFVLGDVSSQFVLTARLVEAPENRTTRLLRVMLGDTERFLRYLLLLLAKDGFEKFGVGDAIDSLMGGGQWHNAQHDIPLLETLLRTLSHHPSSLAHVHGLISELQAVKDEDAIFPQGLMEVWNPIWEAAQEQLR